ncbi:MAG: hypothetical protein ACKVHO_17465 [Verrucomicrobiia bacterium]|jgi:hypothetical protein
MTRFWKTKRYILGLAAILVSGLMYLACWQVSENYTGIRLGTDFEVAHERAITSFAEQRGFGNSRIRHRRFWNEASVVFTEIQYPVRSIRLIGAADPNSPVLYTAWNPPKKNQLSTSEHRLLTQPELKAFTQLFTDSSPVVIERQSEDKHLRVVAPLRARSRCTECHEVAQDALLGAFVYELAEG